MLLHSWVFLTSPTLSTDLIETKRLLSLDQGPHAVNMTASASATGRLSGGGSAQPLMDAAADAIADKGSQTGQGVLRHQRQNQCIAEKNAISHHLTAEHKAEVMKLRRRLDAVVRDVLEAGVANGGLPTLVTHPWVL